MTLVVAVDVGSHSVRAGVIDTVTGRMEGQHSERIRSRRGGENGTHVEQSSREIWDKVRISVKEALTAAGGRGGEVKGIGFDATCSMVAVGKGNAPLGVGDDGDPEWDVVMWMDHRASVEAEQISVSPHPRVLESVGGKVSPEMQLPKLKWLYRHRDASWKASLAKVFDLSDWLAWKAVGSPEQWTTRSACTLVCKWNYLLDPGSGTEGWDPGFLQDVFEGDADAASAALEVMGGTPSLCRVGDRFGTGTPEALEGFGIPQAVAVGCPLIDAHAGALGLCSPEGVLAVIAGTSACLLGTSEDKINIPGVWGPYRDAMVPGYWVNEGGMSASGSTLERLEEMFGRGIPVGPDDAEVLRGLAERSVFVYPDLLGNRSPLADGGIVGMVCGVTLDNSDRTASDVKAAALSSLACGIRHITDAFVAAGYRLQGVMVCGGLSGDGFFLRSLAALLPGVTLCVVEAGQAAAMLRGAAIAASLAASLFPSFEEARARLAPAVTPVALPPPEVQELHRKRYTVHLEMLADQLKYRKLVS